MDVAVGLLVVSGERGRIDLWKLRLDRCTSDAD